MDNSVHQLLAFVGPWPGIFAFDFGRYLIAATLLSSIVLLVPHRAAIFRRTRRNLPRPRQSWFEFRHSLITSGVFAVVGLGVYHGARAGIFNINIQRVDQSWLVWIASLVLIILAHDAYFYWTHRWMHHPRLFRRTHITHHRSVAPTAWAAYSFSIPEALVQAGFLPLFLLVVPISISGSVLFTWIAHQILRNAAGHSGIELVPVRWLATWWGRWLTTTLHHDMHHQEGRGNYGLYFTWWDRWGGTEHPQYRARLATLIQELAEKPLGAAEPSEPSATHSVTQAVTQPVTQLERSSPQSLPQTPP